MPSDIPHIPADRLKLSICRVSKYSILSIGVFLVVFILVLLIFPDLYFNKFLKNKIINEFESSYANHTLNITDLQFKLLENQIEFGALKINSRDSTFSCNIASSSLNGLSWLHLILDGAIAPGTLVRTVAEAKGIVLKFRKSQYDLRCNRLHISLFDSEIKASDLEVYPHVNDDQFFDSGKYRRTRLRVNIPELKVVGLSYHGVNQKNKYHANSIQIPDLSLDVLVNMSKPSEPDTSQMTRDIRTSIKELINVDSLSIVNVQIIYGEIDSTRTAHQAEHFGRYPGYSIGFTNFHYNILKNSGGFGSLGVNSTDSVFLCKIGKSTIKGIDWVQLIWKGGDVSGALTNSVGETQEIDIQFFELGYEFHCDRLNVSLPGSEIIAYDLRAQPLLDEKQFFDESKYRKTSYSLAVLQLKVSGLDVPGLMQGKNYQALSIEALNTSLDVLVSKYKPYQRGATKNLMPNELFAVLKQSIQVDSIRIINGQIKYCEVYKARSEPAVVTFDNADVLALGLSNNKKGGDNVVIHAKANFMRGGILRLKMNVPLSSDRFSFQYSGSLGSMEIDKLNSFLVIAEQTRIKSGTLHTLSFDIKVKNGNANGYVSAHYQDLKLALIDSITGSERGIMNRIKSFVANKIKIHSTNEKNSLGFLKPGSVQYTRTLDNTFIEFEWFSLRSGVADIIGL